MPVSTQIVIICQSDICAVIIARDAHAEMIMPLSYHASNLGTGNICFFIPFIFRTFIFLFCRR